MFDEDRATQARRVSGGDWRVVCGLGQGLGLGLGLGLRLRLGLGLGLGLGRGGRRTGLHSSKRMPLTMPLTTDWRSDRMPSMRQPPSGVVISFAYPGDT